MKHFGQSPCVRPFRQSPHLKVCFLISGCHRSFFNYLHLFFIELNKLIQVDTLRDKPSYSSISLLGLFDVYIDFEWKSGNNFDFSPLFEQPFYKYISLHSVNLSSTPTNLTQKEKNVYIQWFRLKHLISLINESDYDLIVRIRPDCSILITPAGFLELLQNTIHSCISIPEGFNFSDNRILPSGVQCLNDQFAIGPYHLMKQYCSMYDYLINHTNDRPIFSEIILAKYLKEKDISVQRIILPYKLHLFECCLLAITGDSGAGKSIVVDALNSLFPTESSVIIETDRYHKWQRGSPEWSTTGLTHLNPEANHLEKLSEDAFRLKLGDTIHSVDYDHSTGKFTEEKPIIPKPFILFCGLHTFHSEQMRQNCDLKIYLDTDIRLRTVWKILRDQNERGHSLEKILSNIENRREDSEAYILPQKEHANLIIHYSCPALGDNIENNISIINKTDVKLNISFKVSPELHYFVHPFLGPISDFQDGYYRVRHSSVKEPPQSLSGIIKTGQLKQWPINIIQIVIGLIVFNGHI